MDAREAAADGALTKSSAFGFGPIPNSIWRFSSGSGAGSKGLRESFNPRGHLPDTVGEAAELVTLTRKPFGL